MASYFVLIFCFLTISATSFACQSMNGISKKAILLGLDRNSKAYEESKLKESSTSNELTAEQAINIYNLTLDPRYIFGLSSYNKSSGEGPYWIYARQRNDSKPIIIQSLTKSKEYLGRKNIDSSASENIFVKTSHLNESVEFEGISPDLFMKILNASRHSSPNGFNPAVSIGTYLRAVPGKLMQEPELAVEEPGAKSGILQPGESVVLTMKPPLAYRDTSGNILDDVEDVKVNTDWEGDCVVKDWKRCYNITVVGNPSLADPRPPKPKEKLPKYYQLQLDCFSTDPEVAVDFPWLCLKNGWTVNRCHILCMSKCNRDLLLTRKWDYYVLHEGSCKT